VQASERIPCTTSEHLSDGGGDLSLEGHKNSRGLQFCAWAPRRFCMTGARGLSTPPGIGWRRESLPVHDYTLTLARRHSAAAARLLASAMAMQLFASHIGAHTPARTGACAAHAAQDTSPGRLGWACAAHTK